MPSAISAPRKRIVSVKRLRGRQTESKDCKYRLRLASYDLSQCFLFIIFYPRFRCYFGGKQYRNSLIGLTAHFYGLLRVRLNGSIEHEYILRHDTGSHMLREWGEKWRPTWGRIERKWLVGTWTLNIFFCERTGNYTGPFCDHLRDV